MGHFKVCHIMISLFYSLACIKSQTSQQNKERMFYPVKYISPPSALFLKKYFLEPSDYLFQFGLLAFRSCCTAVFLGFSFSITWDSLVPFSCTLCFFPSFPSLSLPHSLPFLQFLLEILYREIIMMSYWHQLFLSSSPIPYLLALHFIKPVEHWRFHASEKVEI